jgi:hypothetical protein
MKNAHGRFERLMIDTGHPSFAIVRRPGQERSAR